MRVFTKIRYSPYHKPQAVALVEISYWETAKLILGYELALAVSGEPIILRNAMAYEAFNTGAPAVAASRSALIPFNRKARRARRWSRFFGA